MDRRQLASPRDRYHAASAQAFEAMRLRIEAGGDFYREQNRFELECQLLRERYNVFLWDGPTTARGYRHPSWPAQ